MKAPTGAPSLLDGDAVADSGRGTKGCGAKDRSKKGKAKKGRKRDRAPLDNTVIVKHIQLGSVSEDEDREGASYKRKHRSYHVETEFYRSFSSKTTPSCRVPSLLACATSDDGLEMGLVLEDLDSAGFSARRYRMGVADIRACLRWLASFHATFLGVQPGDLWETGTYWHLGTRYILYISLSPSLPLSLSLSPSLSPSRMDEYRAMPRGRLKNQAHKHQTLVHGDAKPANFCFADGTGPEGVAAVDFQYVGKGVGVRDVAYLLYREGDSETEAGYLSDYFQYLRGCIMERHGVKGATLAEEVVAEWTSLYPVAVDDFDRFYAGWGC
ncbi:hypothetical protein KIPB_008783 [Kipferlia bialata]|uniref:Aminoglycoside phosphotransferase domain-containing protein n=1 Tax=Kipferlia bialata TaxID=797122 RepID=A0A9K3D2F2_9EUKA|nr:hypothetical protein KIPB_008783 [Kipferlia bialata]|eukprot:g8783.t1